MLVLLIVVRSFEGDFWEVARVFQSEGVQFVVLLALLERWFNSEIFMHFFIINC